MSSGCCVQRLLTSLPTGKFSLIILESVNKKRKMSGIGIVATWTIGSNDWKIF